MAVEGKTIIFCRCFLIFYFVSMDKRPAMGSQPNLASRSEVVCRFTNAGKCPKFWRKKTSNFGSHFSRLPHSTPHNISGEKRCIDKQNTSVNLRCVPQKWTYFPWPLTQRRLRSVCSLWPSLRRPLRCNHHSYDMSSYSYTARSYLI